MDQIPTADLLELLLMLILGGVEQLAVARGQGAEQRIGVGHGLFSRRKKAGVLECLSANGALAASR